MRIGFVTTLLWDRYGPFWDRLARAAGADVVAADVERTTQASTDHRLEAVSGRAFRRAAAEAIALAASSDRIVVPDLNPGYDGSRGSAQDPFVADLPNALRQAVPGLPPIVGVPADLADPGMETIAGRFLAEIAPPAELRRLWQTHRADARPPRPSTAPTAWRPSDATTVALVGQPWHLSDAVRDRLEGPAERLISAHRTSPADLRAEGWRADAGLAPTDAEALGAVRRFARRGGVVRIRMVTDPESGADAWLARKASGIVRRPFETVELPPERHED
ncbi:MAG: hypothetical protein WD336_10740 [Trueperaceae bacterium]